MGFGVTCRPGLAGEFWDSGKERRPGASGGIRVSALGGGFK